MVQTCSPCARVASRCTCTPSSRENACVSASHSCGNSVARPAAPGSVPGTAGCRVVARVHGRAAGGVPVVGQRPARPSARACGSAPAAAHRGAYRASSSAVRCPAKPPTAPGRRARSGTAAPRRRGRRSRSASLAWPASVRTNRRAGRPRPRAGRRAAAVPDARPRLGPAEPRRGAARTAAGVSGRGPRGRRSARGSLDRARGRAGRPGHRCAALGVRSSGSPARAWAPEPGPSRRGRVGAAEFHNTSVPLMRRTQAGPLPARVTSHAGPVRARSVRWGRAGHRRCASPSSGLVKRYRGRPAVDGLASWSPGGRGDRRARPERRRQDHHGRVLRGAAPPGRRDGPGARPGPAGRPARRCAPGSG